MQNPATIPQKRETISDPYVWLDRHQAVIDANRVRNPRLVLIGDSITHYWGGEPRHDIQRGKDSWDAAFEPYRAVNMGFGMDDTRHVLWRIRHGELDGISPRVVQLLIGTNNLPLFTNIETASAVHEILGEIHARLPRAKVLLLGVIPRANRCGRIRALNQLYATFDESFGGAVSFHDAGREVFCPGGCFRPDLFGDGTTHPNAEGNRLFAAAILPVLQRLFEAG